MSRDYVELALLLTGCGTGERWPHISLETELRNALALHLARAA